MRTRAARVQLSAVEQILLVALELSRSTWKVLFTDRLSGQRRAVDVKAWDQEAFGEQLQRAKQRFGLPATVRVISCQEAGRDGFSVHRFLRSLGVESLVADAASLSVSRKRRQAKTDRLDAQKLMDHLLRYLAGEHGAWRVLHVPDEEAEDRRHLQRHLETLRRERLRLRCRIYSLLATAGMRCRLTKQWGEQIDQLRQWNGELIAPTLRMRLEQDWKRLQLVESSIAELKALRRQLLASGKARDLDIVRLLQQLAAIGVEGAWWITTECLGYRHFQNQRQVGACAGLTPTPYASGDSHREQGIGKDGNHRLRWVLIELAWSWLRYQPKSAIARWYRERFGSGKRNRRVGIVAVARKLLIALWRYVEHGIVPEGATLKPAL